MLLQGVQQLIAAEPLARLDYAEIVSVDDLSPLHEVTESCVARDGCIYWKDAADRQHIFATQSPRCVRAITCSASAAGLK